MSEIKGARIWQWMVLLLVLCNIGLIATIWLKPRHEVPPPPGSGRGGPRDFVIQQLKFTDDQVKKYDVLIQAHQDDMSHLRSENTELREQLFANLKNSDQNSLLTDSLARGIGNNQVAIETITYKHFAQVRALCTDEQKKTFDTIIGDVLKKMNGGPGGPRPPGKDGQAPPPHHDGDGPPLMAHHQATGNFYTTVWHLTPACIMGLKIKKYFHRFIHQMAKNLFIALEGTDGSGKSSQAKLLAEKMTSLGHRVYSTCEPTNGPVGLLLQSILKKQIKADHRTIALLFAADRIEHLLDKQEGIIQKLSEGYTVISDRFYFSSYAYNGTYSDIDWVIEINKMCAQLLRPDINIYIDVPPEVCMQRINTNRASTELFENFDSLSNVRGKYFEAFEKLKAEEHIFIMDGNRSIELISADLWQKVEAQIKS